MRFKVRTLLLLLLLLIVLISSGCIRHVTLHPLVQDVVAVKAGENFTPPKDGWFFSDYYVEEVMRVKIK